MQLLSEIVEHYQSKRANIDFGKAQYCKKKKRQTVPSIIVFSRKNNLKFSVHNNVYNYH